MNKRHRSPMPLRVKAVTLAVASCFAVSVQTPAVANPNGFAVVNGQVTFNYNGNTLTVTNTPGSIINWQRFSIGSNELTRFIQQSAASSVLNRVIGVDPSLILGALQSNGRVFLINPNGILFGAGAQIDVGGLVASTLNLSNQDFLAGRLRFTDTPGAGSVVNNAAITTPSGGQVYLIAPSVQNSGIITSPQGEVILAAGRSVELVDAGTPNLRVEITAPDTEAVNIGQIIANSGKIGIYAGLIRNSGVIRADGVVVGEHGEILLKATGNTNLDTGSVVAANGAQGGNITIQSGDTTLISGVVEAKGSEGQGGSVQLLGNQVGLLDGARVDASGQTGGGTVLVGGDYQGRNPDIQNAFRTYVGPDASIRADAVANGDGGKVIVWSDDATRVYGSISARGGALGGNGGFVETSSKGNLNVGGIRVDAGAVSGAAGTWLLDPSDVTVIHGSTGLLSAGLFDPGGPSSIGDTQINAALDGGTNVTLQTSGGTGGSGNITFQDDTVAVSNNSGGSRSLTLNADNNIVVRGSITATSGSLTVQLNAAGQVSTPSGASLTLDGSTSGLTANVNNSKIWSNDGIVTLQGVSTIRLPNPGSGFATFNNNSGATLNVNSTALNWSFLSDPSVQGGIVNNAGTLNVLHDTSWEAAFTNTVSGALNIAAGNTLSMQNGHTIQGSVGIGAGGTLVVSENHGVTTFFNGTGITGSGTLRVTGGIADITNVSAGGIALSVAGPGTATIKNGTSTFGALNVSGGSFGISNGTFTQSSGTLSVPVATYTGNVGYTVGGGGTLTVGKNITTAGDVTLNATNVNVQDAIVSAGGAMTVTAANLNVTASTAATQLISSGFQTINVGGITAQAAASGTNLNARVTSLAGQSITVGASGITMTGGGGTATSNVVEIEQQGPSATQSIIVNGGGTIRINGGAGSGGSNFAQIANLGTAQSITFVAGGAINLTGSSVAHDNGAFIFAASGSSQTISGNPTLALAGGASGNINRAEIFSTGAQNITVGAGGITLTGGGGTSNDARIAQTDAAATQSITVNGGGNIQLNGGAGSGNNNFVDISASGTAQNISFNAGGNIGLTGGTVGSGNSAQIFAQNAQTITGTPNVTMTAGASGGVTNNGNFARIRADVGSQTLTLGTVQLTGGSGGIDNFSVIQSPSQNITVNGNLTLSGSTGGTGSAGSRFGGPADAATSLALTVHGNITLNGGAVTNGGAALGPSSNSVSPQTGNVTVSADGDITLNGGTVAGTRIGQPSGLVGGGDISVTSIAGNLTLGGSVTAGRYALLRATAGAIIDNNGAANNVTAQYLEAAAANGINLDTAISGASPSYVNATNSRSGDIMLRNIGGGATIQNIHNAGGNNILSGFLTDSQSTVNTGGIVIHGEWNPSGGQVPTSPLNPGFTFTATGGPVRIILNSPRANTANSDPYVYLLDASGRVIAEDDDGGQGFVSMLNQSLSAGTYRVVAATFLPGQRTPFDLSIGGSVVASAPGSVSTSSLMTLATASVSEGIIAATDRSTDFALSTDKDKDKAGGQNDTSKKAPQLCN